MSMRTLLITLIVAGTAALAAPAHADEQDYCVVHEATFVLGHRIGHPPFKVCVPGP